MQRLLSTGVAALLLLSPAGCSQVDESVSFERVRAAFDAAVGPRCQPLSTHEIDYEFVDATLHRGVEVVCGPLEFRPGEGGPQTENVIAVYKVHKSDETAQRGGPALGQRRPQS